MKKLILSTTFLIVGTVSLLSQGSAINFSIDPSLPWPDSIDRLIYETTVGVDPVAKDTWAAQLEQDVTGTWTPIGPPVNFIGDFDGFRGYWFDDGVVRTVNVAPGQTASLRISVLDTAAGNRVLASSDPFNYAWIASIPPAAGDTLMVNFRAFAVPEPSTIALGVLGLGALLVFRRRR